ncbi:MAG: trimethylamine methyltransferase family protein, partial [Candidatus Bathyarchaeia archaeon]
MALEGHMCKKPLEILSEEEVKAIHEGSLKVLEETGVVFDHEEALNILKKAGCNVDFEKKLVKFPKSLVEDSLHKCP